MSRNLDPTKWLDDHGDILYRYALARTRNPELSEDLVQDTFLAAWKGAESFSGHSEERTWLVGILKHKMIDHFRKHRRESLADDLETRDHDPHAYLDRKGHWKVGQSEWITQPEKAYERKEFWQVLNGCMDHLNDRLKTVFTLRELEHHNAEEICEQLDISSSNLWVMLHRARLQLKTCMEINWLQRKPESAEE